MDIESLWLFVLVVEKNNISVVGKVFGMVLFIVSVWFVKLEWEFGVDFLYGIMCKVLLFVEGIDFLFYVRDILVQEDVVCVVLGLVNLLLMGILWFIVLSIFVQFYIVFLFLDFFVWYFEVQFDLCFLDKMFDLIEGSFDLVLCNLVMEDSSLKGCKFVDDFWILCVVFGYLVQWGILQYLDDF